MLSDRKEWLSLTEASRLLGIHQSTLRRWADSGSVPCTRTPGGHRRFRATDLADWTVPEQDTSPALNGEALAQNAVCLTRQEMAEERVSGETWYTAFDQEADRQQMRDTGRQLIGLAIQYAERTGSPVLSKGQSIGQLYGQHCARRGISLVDTMRAFSFFRESLLQITPEERVHQGLRRFLDEVMYSCLAGYEAAWHEQSPQPKQEVARLIVGTRGSSLALWQTEHVAGRLQAVTPGLEIEIRTIKTQGDVVRDRPLSQIEGKGFFVKELESALLSGQADLAVHSLKDMPTELPEGLALGAVLERTDPYDALIVREGAGDLSSLPAGARVGTSSLRRRAQLLAARPDLEVADLRGNVDTRLRKLRSGEYDAVVLAAVGLARLGFGEQIGQRLPFDLMLPAPGQGALAVECRADDRAVLELLRSLHHRPTWAAVAAERAFLSGLGGGCSVPVAAYAEEPEEAVLRLHGLVASLDGRRVVRVVGEGSPEEPERLGNESARKALAQGAGAILEEIR